MKIHTSFIIHFMYSRIGITKTAKGLEKHKTTQCTSLRKVTSSDSIFTFDRFAVDLVVCCALGCDMFDCVFPTRTAVSK